MKDLGWSLWRGEDLSRGLRSGCWKVGVGLVRGRRGNGWGGGGGIFFGGGGSCRITDTSKKPQPERQNNVCGNLPIKSRFCPKTLPVKRFFALPIKKFRIPKITDTVKPQRKRCFRQEDFGGSERLGGGVGRSGREGRGRRAGGGDGGVQWGVGGQGWWGRSGIVLALGWVRS